MLQAYYQDELIEAGCDEAGRGCLAGPVFAAAVMLPRNFFHPLLNDSKQLTEEHRYELRPVIEEQAKGPLSYFLQEDQMDRICADVRKIHPGRGHKDDRSVFCEGRASRR